MRKWIILIIMFLTTALAYAETDLAQFKVGEIVDLSVHISSDSANMIIGANPKIYIWNSSWQIVRNSSMNEIGEGWYNYTTTFNETGIYHSVVNLTFNAVNGTAIMDFEIVEDENKMIAMILGIAVISSLFLWLAHKLEREHFILKLLLIFSSITFLTLIPASFIIDADLIFYKYFMRVFVAFWIYVFIFLVYWVLRYAGVIASGKNER